MIVRKMQNNALKNYPKEYDSTAIKEAVKNMIEDYDESLNEKAKAVLDVDAVDKVETEIHQEQSGEAIPGFEIDDNGEVKGDTPAPEPVKAEVKAEPKPQGHVEQIKPDPEDDYGF